eukprot:COSAG02_NODE_32604_length_513_cov_1.657005_1_plen_20_part_01
MNHSAVINEHALDEQSLQNQ